jgi:hypothetical protein
VIRRFAIAAVLCVALSSGRANAQQSQMSFDATIGKSYGSGGGERQNRDGLALDALIAWRGRSRSLFHGVFGFGAGVQGDKTDTPCLPLPGSGCVPDFPRIYTLGVYFGLEHQGRAGAARLLAGPTHYRIDGGGGALGGQLRLELVSPAVKRIAAVASARGGLVWKLDRQDYRLAAVSVGLGIY